MTRTMPSAYTAALDDDLLMPVYFVELRFDAGTLYFHSDIGDITTFGASPIRTWTGVADLGNIEPINEILGINPVPLRVSLSGIDSTLLSEALENDYNDRIAIVYFGLRNVTTGVMLDEPFEIFRGFIDEMETLNGPGQGIIVLTIESEMVEFRKAPIKYYSNQQHQEDHNGDLFLEYISELQGKKIQWGGFNYKPTVYIDDPSLSFVTPETLQRLRALYPGKNIVVNGQKI